jgi:hypothetical protein
MAVAIFFLWILPVIIATSVGSHKGRGFTGFLAGAIFSWLGVFCMLVASPVRRNQVNVTTVQQVATPPFYRQTTELNNPAPTLDDSPEANS